MATDCVSCAGLSLDEDRLEVLAFLGPMMLVDGPAGCGKTWLAVQKVKRLVEDGTLAEGQRVLCVSFSRAARTRMVQILAEHVPDYKDKVLVMTFDSLALSLVRKYPRQAELSGPVRIMPQGHLRTVTSERDGHYLDFAELRERALCILQRPHIARAYADLLPSIVVDEFQDTGPAHYAILELLTACGSRLCAFGDTYQDINTREPFDPLRKLTEKELLHVSIAPKPNNNRFSSREVRVIAECIRAKQPVPGEIADGLVTAYQKDWGDQLAAYLGCHLRELRNAGIRSVCILCRRNADVLQASNLLYRKNPKWGLPCYHKVELGYTVYAEVRDLLCAVWQSMIERGDQICAVVGSICLGQEPEDLNDLHLLPPPCPLAGDECVCARRRPELTGRAAEDIELVGEVAGELLSSERITGKTDWLSDEIGDTVSMLRRFLPRGSLIRSPKEVRLLFGRLTAAMSAQHDYAAPHDPKGVRVMTINQAKNREFDASILIYSYRHRWSAGGEEDELRYDRMLIYQAASRAKRHFHVFYYEDSGGHGLGPILTPLLGGGRS